MKKNSIISKAILTIALMLSTSLSTLAYDFEYNGIYYNVINTTEMHVEVTYKSFYEAGWTAINDYSGDIVIPNDVPFNGETYTITAIGYKAFENSKSLKSVDMPNSVIRIEDEAFSDCYYLTSVKLSDSLETIGRSAFYQCENLKSISIPKSVKTIREHAFSVCKNLEDVNITDLSAWCKIDFEYYPANPLCYAKSLKLNGVEITDLVIPNNVKRIKPYSFPLYQALKSVTMHDAVTEIGDYAFYSCNKLANFTINEGVKKIGDYAFYHCNNLESIIIPNTVGIIGKYAFNECSELKSIVLGSSLYLIGEYAFSTGGPLDSITSLNVEPPMCSYPVVFGGLSTKSWNVLLNVPEGAKEAYANADEWCNFTNIQEIAGVEDIEVDNNAVEVTRYDIHGRELSQPTTGVNIIKMSDGTTRKVIVK
ncbi:MAG: leucine-rich repeat domain-containing protein [Muribaculaceae bacterium]|nr:leucine-rich repeat domain-containing protein [Muribaculaceae bacterium]